MTQTTNKSEKASNKALTEKLIGIRKRAQTRLAHFSKLQPEDGKEVYLFHNDQFCGVRFTLGPFRAVWRLEENSIRFFRGKAPIDRIDLDEAKKRAA